MTDRVTASAPVPAGDEAPIASEPPHPERRHPELPPAAAPEEAPVRHHAPPSAPVGRRLLILSLTALGVVYGDIGTSPLYAVKECVRRASTAHADARERPRRHVAGVLVDDPRRGPSSTSPSSCAPTTAARAASSRCSPGAARHAGPTAAGAAIDAHPRPVRRRAALRRRHHHAGDLGAQRGRGTGDRRAAPLSHAVVPATVVILLRLFMVQRAARPSVVAAFGPVTLVWFIGIAADWASP